MWQVLKVGLVYFLGSAESAKHQLWIVFCMHGKRGDTTLSWVSSTILDECSSISWAMSIAKNIAIFGVLPGLLITGQARRWCKFYLQVKNLLICNRFYMWLSLMTNKLHVLIQHVEIWIWVQSNDLRYYIILIYFSLVNRSLAWLKAIELLLWINVLRHKCRYVCASFSDLQEKRWNSLPQFEHHLDFYNMYELEWNSKPNNAMCMFPPNCTHTKKYSLIMPVHY